MAGLTDRADSPAEPDLADAVAVERTADEGMEALAREAVSGLGRERRQIFLLVVLVAAFMAVAHFTPLRSWIENAQEWKQQLRALGWVSHAAFLALTALAVLIGIPRLTLCAAGGLLFGFSWGLALSLAGSTIGSYGTFLMVRHGFRGSVSRQAEGRPWLRRLLSRPSLVRVFWVRQLALPGLVLNAILAVTEIRHRIFLGGTLLGYIPLNIAATLVGSGLGKQDLQQTIVQLAAALAVINGLVWLVWRRLRKTAP
jgi:uncharacterized membrane protein YdjX (TVP38/TMEM64 family)